MSALSLGRIEHNFLLCSKFVINIILFQFNVLHCKDTTKKWENQIFSHLFFQNIFKNYHLLPPKCPPPLRAAGALCLVEGAALLGLV
jgi:hypothetical protein